MTIQLQRSAIGNAVADCEVCRSFGLVGDGVLIIGIIGIEFWVIELIGESGSVLKFIGCFQNQTRGAAGNLEVTGHRVAGRQGILELKVVYGRTVGFDFDFPCDLARIRVITAVLVQLILEIDIAVTLFAIGIGAVGQVLSIQAVMIYNYIVFKDIALVLAQFGQTRNTVHLSDLDARVSISNAIAA